VGFRAGGEYFVRLRVVVSEGAIYLCLWQFLNAAGVCCRITSPLDAEHIMGRLVKPMQTAYESSIARPLKPSAFNSRGRLFVVGDDRMTQDEFKFNGSPSRLAGVIKAIRDDLHRDHGVHFRVDGNRKTTAGIINADSPFVWHEEVDPLADFVRIYFFKPDEGKLAFPDVTIKVYSLSGDGQSKVIVTSTDEHWIYLVKAWEALKQKLKADGWIDESDFDSEDYRVEEMVRVREKFKSEHDGQEPTRAYLSDSMSPNQRGEKLSVTRISQLKKKAKEKGKWKN
jgi:hypothetical protein